MRGQKCILGKGLPEEEKSLMFREKEINKAMFPKHKSPGREP